MAVIKHMIRATNILFNVRQRIFESQVKPLKNF